MEKWNKDGIARLILDMNEGKEGKEKWYNIGL